MKLVVQLAFFQIRENRHAQAQQRFSGLVRVVGCRKGTSGRFVIEQAEHDLADVVQRLVSSGRLIGRVTGRQQDCRGNRCRGSPATAG